MAFDNTKLSYFHSFSKMPAQDSTTLGNAINKSGHTVTASEVWAQDIPYYGKMGSLEDVKSKVQPYARKNDMCYITAGADKGKTFQYDGNGNWTDITATLIDGALIKNANDDVVLLYHKGQTLTNLTADNNANTDSADNAARLWAKRDTEGVTIPNSGTRLIEQFAAPTDKALNGLASVAYAPVIANGSLVSGEDYYDYCFSGTILWASKRTTSTVIDCFEYVGQKVSTVVDTVTTNAAEIKSVKDQVDTISDALGLGATPGQDTLGSRVSKTESALRTMLGLGTDAEVVASQSIAKSIQDAIDNLGDVAVKSDITINDIKVKVGSGEATSLTPVNKSVTIEIPDAPEAVVTAEGTVTTDGFTKTAAVTSLANAAINAAISGTDGAIADAIDQGISDATLTSGDNAIESATGDTATKLVTAAQVKEYVDENAKVTLTAATADGSTGITISPNGQESTSFTIGIDQTKIATKQSVDELSGLVSGLPATIEAAQDAADAAMLEAQAKVASVTGPTTGLVTVSGDKEVTITVSDTIATKDYASTAATTAVNGLKETAITSQSVSGAGVSVTLGGKVGAPTLTGSVTPASYTSATKTWTNDSNFAKASDIATAIADAVGSIEIPAVVFSGDAQKVGFRVDVNSDADEHYLTLATAAYTKAEYDETGKVTTEGSWTDASKNYLVTGDVVRDFVGDAAGKTLEAAKAYSDSLHSTSLDYVVLGDNETLPDASADTVGKIYLVKEGNTANGESNIDAISGSYVEYMTRKVSETEYTWEKIGTTAADLSGYAKTVKINGQSKSASANEINLGTVVTGVYNQMASGITSGSEQPNEKSIYAEIYSGGLHIGVASATDSVMGVSKMFTGELSTAVSEVKDTAVSVKSAQAMYSTLAGLVGSLSDSKIDSVQGTNYLKLAGLAVDTNDNDVTISTIGIHGSDCLPLTTVKVENGMVYASNGWSMPLNTNAIVNGEEFLQGRTTFTSWISDLSNMTKGISMFQECSNLTTFVGDLSSLTNGYNMFYLDTALTSFCGDLSSLTNGRQMFYFCKLDAESLECIADTINDVRSLTTSTEVTKTIDISYNCSAADAQAAYDTITSKGWSCIIRYND